MYDLYPYFTNDGTVGLYSPQDDDIYHSTYGALTESWEKFAIPAHLAAYIAEHNEVKILDICFGIGYNTKTALNVFLNEVEKKEKIYKSFLKNNKNNCKNKSLLISNNAAIDTDNILANLKEKNNEIHVENQKIITNNTIYNASLDTDNIPKDSEVTKLTCKNEFSVESKNIILIDAVDSDKTLIGLSPFIIDEVKNKFLFRKNIFKINFKNETSKNKNETNNKLFQIQKMQKSQIYNLKKEFKLKKEVSIILLEKLLENDNNLINDEILQKMLSEKKYSPYLSNFMLNLARFYSNQGYKSNLNCNKSTFLHNIYYQYLSRSYKNAQKLQKTAQIDLNFHPIDARSFVKSTSSTYNYIFLDAFTPSKCPALWTLDFFGVLYSKLDDDGMILTYSNSAAIRNAFLKSGFFVGKIYNAKTNKFTGTVAVKNNSLIEHVLDNKDLDLINSKAGICYRDANLDLTNDEIIKNRNLELSQSDLVTSSKVLKEHRGI